MISALIMAILIFLGIRNMWPMTWAKTSSGKMYYVKKGKTQKSSAEMLHRLTQKLHRFLEEADDLYPGDRRIANIRSRWNGTLAEVGSGKDIAYSVNKKNIHICIRSPEGRLEDSNSAMYVLLHEAAHVATDAYGHPPIFWKNFRWLLEVAEKLGLYTYEDFDTTNVTHCGHTLGNNIMRCIKHKTCKSLLE